MEIHVVTLTDESEHPNVKNLEESLQVSRKKFHVLHDYDKKLKNLSKIYKTLDYVRDCSDIADNDIICIVDGHDVIFNNKLHNLQDIISKFKELGADIVFSTENKCTHHTSAAKQFFESTLPKNRYLNSGVIIAYKKQYVILFSDILENITYLNFPPLYSDQRVIGQYLASFQHNLPVKVHFDTNDVYALTLNSSCNVTCSNIGSFFVHITFLANSSQLKKYNDFLGYTLKQDI
jgi:hypothetical protein